MNDNEFIIGVLGGMGTFATINLFEQYANIFPAEKEWERPRIIIDNHCTMPSRVRAILYDENKNKLIAQMTDSLRLLINAGATNIILGCNTSHIFLPEIYKTYPEAEEKIINIIDTCVDTLIKNKINSVYLLATEGTILSNVYQQKLEKANIECLTPDDGELTDLRDCIEAVKQNNYTENIKRKFIDFIERHNTCILGCTELPLLYKRYRSEINPNITVYDPLKLALYKVKENYIVATGGKL